VTGALWVESGLRPAFHPSLGEWPVSRAWWRWLPPLCAGVGRPRPCLLLLARQGRGHLKRLRGEASCVSDDDTGEVDKDARITELERQLAVERASFQTGVPAEILSAAATPEDALRLATDALLWRAETAPPPPPQTAAVSADMVTAGTGVIGAADRILPRYQQVQTRDAVSRMTPAEILSAWRAGHLSQIGVGAPTTNGSTPLTRRS
jgi:hypothetical protein